jgi:hypothetical protein
MKRLSTAALLIVTATFCASASPINIEFPQTVYDVLPGELVDVTAILQNTDPNDPVYLNGDDLNVPESASSTDFFFTNVPISLNPSASTATIELFSFVVSSTAAPGTYTGTYDLFGGVGTANQYNFDLVGSQSFSIFVAPEPSTMLLLGCGLMAIAAVSQRWRRARCK